MTCIGYAAPTYGLWILASGGVAFAAAIVYGFWVLFDIFSKKMSDKEDDTTRRSRELRLPMKRLQKSA
ncbi:MAG TPA: hypothetical protein VIW68_12685 [Candidatus Sulfotelmatobacter sp.]